MTAANKDGDTALHLAAKNGNDVTVQLLVRNGADVNAVNNVGNAALHVAANRGYASIVEHLVSKGADVNAANRVGNTALHVAANRGYASIVNILESAAKRSSAISITAQTECGKSLHAKRTRSDLDSVNKLELAGQNLTIIKGSERRNAILSLLAENHALRDRLRIKPGLEVKQDFNVCRLVEIAITKCEMNDTSLRADVEAEIDFQIEANKMLYDDSEIGSSMRL